MKTLFLMLLCVGTFVGNAFAQSGLIEAALHDESDERLMLIYRGALLEKYDAEVVGLLQKAKDSRRTVDPLMRELMDKFDDEVVASYGANDSLMLARRLENLHIKIAQKAQSRGQSLWGYFAMPARTLLDKKEAAVLGPKAAEKVSRYVELINSIKREQDEEARLCDGLYGKFFTNSQWFDTLDHCKVLRHYSEQLSEAEQKYYHYKVVERHYEDSLKNEGKVSK